MRRVAVLMLAISGCGAGEASVDEDAILQFCCRVPQAQIEITKHVRDGERFERAGMLDEAEREFWLAELKLFGLQDRAMRDFASYVRSARLRVRPLRPVRPPVGG